MKMSLDMRPICVMHFYIQKTEKIILDGVSVTEVIDCI